MAWRNARELGVTRLARLTRSAGALAGERPLRAPALAGEALPSPHTCNPVRRDWISRRRRASQPVRPKPSSMLVQVAGSGMAMVVKVLEMDVASK